MLKSKRKRNCSTTVIYTICINIYICFYYICCTYLYLIGIFHTSSCNSYLLDFCVSFPRMQENKHNCSTTMHISPLPHFSSCCIRAHKIAIASAFFNSQMFIRQMRTRTVVIAMCHYS